MNGRAKLNNTTLIICKKGISHFGSIEQRGISREIPHGNYHPDFSG